MKLKYMACALAIGALSVACDDKLDIPQQGVLNMDTYYRTDEDAAEALAAVYSNWASQMVNNDYMNKSLLADDCYSGGNGPADGGDRAGFSRAFYDVNCGLVKDMYQGYYTVINRANLVIDNFTGADDTPVKRNALAEARFFRAYCYMELVTLWGDVPLVTHVLNSDEGCVENTPAATTWQFIESELSEIINQGYLTEKANVADQQAGTRPTKQTAQAYLGKALLFQGKYADALVQFKNVISSGLYALTTGAEYANMFHNNGNYSPEYILSNNTVLDAANYYTIPWTFAILNNWIWGNSKLQIRDWGKATAFFGPGAMGVDLDFTMGYGFFNPTEKLAAKFVEIEGKDGYRLNQTIVSHDKMHDVVGAWLEEGNDEGAGSQHFEHCGWYRHKLLCRKSDQYPYTAWLGCAINVPAMRYAELLLMAAEAGFKTGDAQAVNWFNEVRTRAQAPLETSLTMQKIQDEFFVETCFEGHRYQDLQRWDRNGDIDMVAVLKDKGKKNVYFATLWPQSGDPYPKVQTDFENKSFLYYVPATEQRAGFEAYEKLLPFPQAELDVNPNIRQNTGWGAAVQE